ncbi:MAG: SU10 major capsid protein [Candidatus Heimdallarchaeota archaeon]
MDDVRQSLAEIKDLIMKAAETTSTYTFSPATRSIFSPENLEEEIKWLVPVDTPLRKRLPRVRGRGEAATWKKMTSAIHAGAHPSVNVAAGTGTSVAFADADEPGETTQTYATATATYKLLGRKLEVGGLALAASKGRDGQPDMQKSRERVKLYEVMLGEEELLIAGDSSARSNEFDGLNKQITTNSGSCTFITASGIGAWCRQLYKYGADPTLLLASARQLQALADDMERSGTILRQVVAQKELQGVIGGLALVKIVNPVTSALIDVRPSRFVGYGGLLLTEKSPAGENWIEVEELIPISRVDVPSSKFSYVSFIVEALALKVMGEPFQLKFCTGA